MVTENEDINTTGNEEKPKHHTWMEDSLEKLESDFPLSGGETDDDLEHSLEPAERDETTPGDEGPVRTTTTEERHTTHTSWIEGAIEKVEDALGNMNTDFPLSGGETDEDLENAEHAK
jgi:hypothetical protein